MKVFCAIAMCSVAWADIANFDTLVTSCSDGSRAPRLHALKTRLSKNLLEGYRRIIEDMCLKAEGIVWNIMEVPAYELYARHLLQMPSLHAALAELTRAEGPATHQITVKQYITHIASAVYVLPQIIMAIEMLEKEVQNGELDRKFRAGQLKQHGVVPTADEYAELLQNIKKLEINKQLLFIMMKDLQDMKTPLDDLITDGVCSTREAYALTGMTYVPDAPAHLPASAHVHVPGAPGA